VPRTRPLIAFFDYHDVFEDFYSHYGVTQKVFATRWANTGNHAFLSILQRDVGDVIWYAFSLAPELSEARHEVVGCRVRMLPSSWMHRQLWRMFYLSRYTHQLRRAYPLYANLASYVALASWPFLRALLRDRPDFLFVQDYASGRFDVLLLTARALGVPLIARHSGSRPEWYCGPMIKQWTIRRAEWLIVSSQDESEMLARRFHVPRQRLRMILTPIDTAVFRPMERSTACDAMGLDPARRYLLFVGRLDDRIKRVSALIGTFAGLSTRYPDTDLVIAGEGEDGQSLRNLATKLPAGRVRFLGWVSLPEAKAQLYNAAECLLLPSRSEGFPTVVGEAMACGTPVLASKVGGVGEMVVPGETGWLFAPGDDEALAQGMAFVLDHPALVASMRPQARHRAETCVAPEVIAAQLRTCFSGGSGSNG
jgi:glycosyltransferase involved in cell wall biosynthesis